MEIILEEDFHKSTSFLIIIWNMATMLKYISHHAVHPLGIALLVLYLFRMGVEKEYNFHCRYQIKVIT